MERNGSKKVSLQGVTPEQDILAEAMACTHDDDDILQILINETKIEAIEKIQVIVIPLEIPVKF